MIIGLAGRQRSGKDSVGALLVAKFGFVRVAFADAIREFIAGMLGQPLEYVRSEFFKTDTHAASFARVCGFAEVAGEHAWQFEHAKLTGRDLLKNVGQTARKLWGENHWVDIALAKCRGAEHEDHAYLPAVPDNGRGCAFWTCDSRCGLPDWAHPFRQLNYVITDCRFPNEVHAIQSRGGVVLRLNRDDRQFCHEFFIDTPTRGQGCDYTFHNGDFCGLPVEAHPSHATGDVHPSETSLPDSSNAVIHYEAEFSTGSGAGQAAAVEEWLRDEHPGFVASLEKSNG